MNLIETAPHEFDGYLLFGEWGLDPIFACDAVIKQADGKRVREFTNNGETWEVTLRYQDSNIVHPGNRTPTGTEWQMQPDTDTNPNTVKREYRIEIERAEEEDRYGQQGFVGHIVPRWSGMEGVSSDGDTHNIYVPDDVEEGIQIRVQGSNIEFERYPELLRDGFAAVDINRRYISEVHESSNINDAERYVRVQRDPAGKIHARDGPIAGLGHLCERDRRGFRKLVQKDENERGEAVPGYYHTATLGTYRINEAWPGHELPKEIKLYKSKEGESMPESHPLAHPKLGASYQTSLADETLYWDDLEQLNEELEETVHSVLQDAGIPLHSTEPYVINDEYFSVDFRSGHQPTTLDLTQIESEQESVVVKHLADGLSPVQWDALGELVTDGGQVSPDDIADRCEWHPESVRRALREMDDLVDRKYADVGLKSDYVAEMVHQAVRDAEQAVTNAVETAANAMANAERAVDESMAAWVAWADKHDIDINDARKRMRLEFSEDDFRLNRLREAQRIWRDAGQDLRRLRVADVIVNGTRKGKLMHLVGIPD